MTLVAAWHHEEIGDLVKELLKGEEWRLGDLAWPSEWPKHCGSGMWDEPDSLSGSRCYDLVWRIALIREAHAQTGEVTWRATALTASLQGFRGKENDPCREGLTSLASVEM